VQGNKKKGKMGNKDNRSLIKQSGS